MTPDPTVTKTSRSGTPGTAAAAATGGVRDVPAPDALARTIPPPSATLSSPGWAIWSAASVAPSGDQKNAATESARSGPDSAGRGVDQPERPDGQAHRGPGRARGDEGQLVAGRPEIERSRPEDRGGVPGRAVGRLHDHLFGRPGAGEGPEAAVGRERGDPEAARRDGTPFERGAIEPDGAEEAVAALDPAVDEQAVRPRPRPVQRRARLDLRVAGALASAGAMRNASPVGSVVRNASRRPSGAQYR